MSLSLEQIDSYFDRIALPQAVRKSLRQGDTGIDALKAVTALQQYHMTAVPFENLELHYSDHRSLSQEPDIVYENVVARNRGGTCPQIHLLFARLLRSLGFQVYCTGGRINSAASPAADTSLDKFKVAYGPWVHVNTIVTVGANKYVVDTSFGPFGSPCPILLAHNEPIVDVWPRYRRMIHSSIPGWTDKDQKWWRMQYGDSINGPWMDVNCFVESEWRPVDFQIMVAGIESLGLGWFKSSVVCFRIILEEDIPVGYLMIWQDELRRFYKGQSHVLEKFHNESDRAAALETNFNIWLTDNERKQIVGTNTELKDLSFDFYG